MHVIGKIQVDMASVQSIMDRLGVTARGDVQQFHTANVRRRIQRYMPYRSGATIKLMIVQSPADEPFIHINAPYAHYLYKGKVWVDPKTRAAGFLTANGWRSRKNVPKIGTDRDLQFDRTKNPMAGPYWDRNLVAAEGEQMRTDLQEYVDRKAREK